MFNKPPGNASTAGPWTTLTSNKARLCHQCQDCVTSLNSSEEKGTGVTVRKVGLSICSEPHPNENIYIFTALFTGVCPEPLLKSMVSHMLSWHDFEGNVGDTLHLLDQLSSPRGGRLVNFLQT